MRAHFWRLGCSMASIRKRPFERLVQDYQGRCERLAYLALGYVKHGGNVSIVGFIGLQVTHNVALQRRHA